MASVADAPRFSSSRLLTVADLAALPDELPSGPVKYELDNGRLVLMAPPGGERGRTQHRVGWVLANYAERRGLGEAFAEVGLILRRNPDRVVGPDAAFVAKRSLPVRMSSEGYLETIPEIVVEVRSKNDDTAELEAKVDEYLGAGVRIVWIVDPSARTVTVYRSGKDPEELRCGDTLTAERAVRGLKAPVSELFDD